MQLPLARAPRDAIRRLNCCDNDTDCVKTDVALYAALRVGVGLKEETLDARNLTCESDQPDKATIDRRIPGLTSGKRLS
jgi:hypothetical protein